MAPPWLRFIKIIDIYRWCIITKENCDGLGIRENNLMTRMTKLARAQLLKAALA